MPVSRSVPSLLLQSFLVAAITATGALARVDLGPLDPVRDEFNQQYRLVRDDHLLLPLTYIEVDGTSYGYQIPVRLREMAHAGASFRLRKVKTQKNALVFEIESDRQSRLKIYLFDANAEISSALVRKVAPIMLRDLFVFGERLPAPRVVGNLRSRMAHAGVCNHLPPTDQRVNFASVAACLEDGYRLCPSCFQADPPLPLPRYMVVRQEALENARLYQVAFPLIDNPALQDSLQALGESLVAALPFPAKNFPYRFRAVDSELMQATSFPTGFVFVTDKLLDAVEEDAELAHVLAHEIVHCELHLPPNPQISAPSILGTTTIWEDYYAKLRWRESESDVLAIDIVGTALGVPNPLEGGLQIIRKLQFASEAGSFQQDARYDSHPSYGPRLTFLQDGFYALDLGRYFEARNEQDDWIVRVKIIGAGWDEKGVGRLHFFAMSSPEARTTVRIANRGLSDTFSDDVPAAGTIHFTGGTSLKLMRGAAVEMSPGEMGTFVLQLDEIKRDRFGPSSTGSPREYDPSRIDGLELVIGFEDHWVAVEGDW